MVGIRAVRVDFPFAVLLGYEAKRKTVSNSQYAGMPRARQDSYRSRGILLKVEIYRKMYSLKAVPTRLPLISYLFRFMSQLAPIRGLVFLGSRTLLSREPIIKDLPGQISLFFARLVDDKMAH